MDKRIAIQVKGELLDMSRSVRKQKRLALYFLGGAVLASSSVWASRVHGADDFVLTPNDVEEVRVKDRYFAKIERAPQPRADAETNATSWVVYSGEEIHKALQRWAERAGWSFSWKPKRTWVAPTEVVLEGTFEEAIARFVIAMYEQGKPVRLILWKGNRFAEIVDDESE